MTNRSLTVTADLRTSTRHALLAALEESGPSRSLGRAPSESCNERPGPWHLSVPGRIEVLGKHTDYCGGRSLVCALEHSIDAVCRPTEAPELRIVEVETRSSSPRVGERQVLRLDEASARPSSWCRFPWTVVERLRTNFGELKGLDLAFTSRVPRAAGASSSSALIVLFYLALARRNKLHERAMYRSEIASPADLAQFQGCIENGRSFGALQGEHGVGTFGGSQDHAAILLSRKDRLLELGFGPLTVTSELALPETLTFVLASSGVRASKSGPQKAAYNRLSLLAAEALDAWEKRSHTNDRHLADTVRRHGLRDVLNALSGRDDLVERVQHFHLESEELVPLGISALRAGRLADFARACERSQQAAQELLSNQVPETVDLVAFALAEGAVAASAFGAGFGGSVWALVPTSEVEAFAGRWRQAYEAGHPEHSHGATFFSSRPGPGAQWIAHENDPQPPPIWRVQLAEATAERQEPDS